MCFSFCAILHSETFQSEPIQAQVESKTRSLNIRWSIALKSIDLTPSGHQEYLSVNYHAKVHSHVDDWLSWHVELIGLIRHFDGAPRPAAPRYFDR